MALYLGSDRVKINSVDGLLCLNIYSSSLLVNGVILLSSDNYILRDSNGVYLTAKEEK